MSGDAPQIKQANRRGAARLAAAQALYQMEISNSRLTDIVAEYENIRIGQEVDGDTYLDADRAWFRSVLAGVVELQKSIDPVIQESLPAGWPLQRIEALLRAILRAGVYELARKGDVPAVVVISEYVDVAKAFFDEDEWRMVNAVLDSVARKVKSADPSLKALRNGEPS